MTLQKLLSYLRRCDADFSLIKDGDRIGVGLSGGKDSIALLCALSAYRRFAVPFELCAVTIDAGAGADYTPMRELCDGLGVPYYIEKTQIYQIVFDERKEKNPCSLCAKMRRGALDNKLKEIGCNTLALGHNADDLVETFLMSVLFEGRLSTLAPASVMERAGIKLIRPLLYVREKDTAAFIKGAGYCAVKNPCPADGHTSRQRVKELIRSLSSFTPDAFERIHSALIHPERNNLIKKP